MKAAMLALALWLGLGGWAAGATLVTGAVRDAQGLAVAGASVKATDSGGVRVGSARTDTDGTFALDASAPPATVRIECAYCRPRTVAVHSGEPVVAVVERYQALIATGPTPADLAALPYARVEEALALRPFEVLRPQSAIPAALYPALSDRGLARSALILDGEAPTYSLGISSTALGAIPAHSGNAAGFAPASDAYRYGNYASGGTIAFFRDDTPEQQLAYNGLATARLSAGDARAGISLGNDADSATQRARAIASARAPLFGGSFDAALSLSSSELEAPTVRTSERSGTFGFTRDFDRVRLRLVAAGAGGTNDVPVIPNLAGVWSDSLFAATASASSGLFRFEAGASHVNASAFQTPLAPRYAQDNLFFALHVTGNTQVDAGAARTFVHVYDGQQRSVTLPSLLITQRLGEFALTGGLSNSLLAVSVNLPYVLASLAEAHLTYGDDRRLRAEVQTYRRTSESAGPLAGSGASLTYQLTPTTSIRAWTLRLFGDGPEYTSSAIFIEPYLSGDALWLTHQSGNFRIDAVYRRTAGAYTIRRAFDYDVYFPYSAHGALGFRSSLEPQGRQTSLVLRIIP